MPDTLEVDSPEAMRALYAVARRRRVPAATTVIHEGDTPETLYLISSGSAGVALSNWHGEAVMLWLLGPGDYFGEMGMLPGGSPTRAAEVQTRSDCLLLEIRYADFIAIASDHPALWLQLAGQLAARLRAANRRVVGMRVLSLGERIEHVLADLADRSDAQPAPGGRRLRITRDELGMLAGCTRETAGRALTELETAGRVRLDGRSIVVLDRGAAAAARSPAQTVPP